MVTIVEVGGWMDKIGDEIFTILYIGNNITLYINHTGIKIKNFKEK